MKAFESIVINKENLGMCQLTLSTARTAEDSDGKTFVYYWAKLGDHLCCTGSKFTKLLGNIPDNATDEQRDAALKAAVKAGQNQFIIAQATDENDNLIFIPIKDKDGNVVDERPLLKIQAKAHSVTAEW